MTVEEIQAALIQALSETEIHDTSNLVKLRAIIKVILAAIEEKPYDK